MTSINKLILFFTLIFLSLGVSAKSSLVKINSIPLDFELLSFSLMQGDTAFIETEHEAILTDSDGNKHKIGQSYQWIAPQASGIYSINIQIENQNYKVNFLVMKSMLQIKNTPNDFKIGSYPKKPYKGLSQYIAPKGMIEITEENKDTNISPHFQLKDFLVKQKSGYPKYVIISTKLIYKLELIISRLIEKGYQVDHLHVMSGYRTPYYNAKIGNGKSSRHIYGDAADIYLDNDRNNAMDDLNNDGKIDIKDARILAAIVEEIDKEEKYKWLIGGLGAYSGNGNHHGFIHVDTRGFKARW